MTKNLFSSFALGLAAMMAVGLMTQTSNAQTTVPPDTNPIPTEPVQQPTTDNGNQGSGDTSTTRSNAGVGEADEAIDLETTPDQRNQGFVGATAEKILENGFIGFPRLEGEASFGGGVNNSVGAEINIGTGGGGGRGGAGGLGGNENGFNVQRQSVRARLVPNFYAPPRSSQQVVSRFSGHFSQQPGSNQTRGNYSIRIQNKTAFLNGSVFSQVDSQRLVRQLRLEPGVYKIVNQLRVLQQ